MNKSLIALFATLIAAATAFAPAADAGFKVRLGFGGPLPGFTAHGPGHGGYGHRHYQRKRYIVRHVTRSKERVAKKAAPAAPKVAKVEKKVSKPKVIAQLPVEEIKADKVAEIENSSITTALADPIEASVTAEPEASTPAPQPTAAIADTKTERTASKIDCKKFFPSVGMTLTVPCE